MAQDKEEKKRKTEQPEQISHTESCFTKKKKE